MNRIKPWRSALAALLMVACWSPRCSAAVVVFANRTPREVEFILVEQAEERALKLAPGELAAFRTGPGTGFWFADEPNHGYRLRGGCAYVFLHSRRLARRELHRIQLVGEDVGLVGEDVAPDDETETGPGPAEAAKPSIAGSPAEQRRAARIAVRLACDASGTDQPDVWEARLRACLRDAARITTRQCGVTFEAVDFQRWRPDRPLADDGEALRDLRSALPAQPGELVIGFTTRPDRAAPCAGPPATAPLASHLLIREGPQPTPQHERLEALLHALGHYLGAAHSPEPDSLMRSALDPTPAQPRSALHFDPVNALAMALVADDLSLTKPRALPDLSPGVRTRLESIYATLSEALPADPTAASWLRLLKPAARDAAEPAMPAARRQEELPPSETESPPPLEPRTPEPARGVSDEAAAAPVERAADKRAADLARDDPLAANVARESLDEPSYDSQPAQPLDHRVPDENRAEIPRALALALLLLALPAAMVVWRLADRNPHGVGADDPSASNGQPLKAIDRAGWWAYLASVAIVGGWVTHAMLSGQQAGFKAAALLLFAGMTVMTVAPLYPMAGPLVYLVLSYSLQREDPAAARIEDSGIMGYLVVLAVAALILRLVRQRRWPRPPREAVVWALLGMMAWIGVSVLNATLDGLPVTPNLVHRAARFVQVLVLFLVTFYAGAGLAELRLTTLLLALSLVARVYVFHAHVRLEQNLAMVAAMVCPLLWVTAQTAPARLAMLGCYLLLAHFVCLIGYIQNRAAMVALPVAAAVLLLSSRHRTRALLLAAPVAVALAAWLPSSGLLDRFTGIYQQGQFQESAYYRLRLWGAGWHMALDHAVLGVGPGNFDLLVQNYDPDLLAMGPHNGVVQMAAETGLVGVALYLGLILSASLRLAATVWRYRDDWRGCLAGGVLAGLAAHVVTGLFLENPSLAVTYVLLAQGLTLSAVPVTHVYRERLRLPLPDFLAQPLADFSLRWPRVVSGMPVAWRSPSRCRPAEGGVAGAARESAWPKAAGGAWLLLALYAALTVAGSLTPFSFQAASVDAALSIYGREMGRAIEFSDRADWLSNVLLFVPLGFLAMAACCGARRRFARRAATSFLVVIGCLLFSASIELAQVWFPSRTVNPNDVAAETLGAALGVVVFLLVGDRLVAMASSVLATRRPLCRSEKLLACYAAAVLVYAAWPFDFTISPSDLAGKLRDGRLDLADWSRPGWLSVFMASLLLMAPIGFLLRTVATPRGRPVRGCAAALGWGLAWLLAIEFCRLLTLSQSVGVLHLAGGAAGMVCGAFAWAGTRGKATP